MKPSAIPRGTPEPVCGALADVIREHREARRLSKYALAKLAGISREMVGLIEARRSIPTFDLAARICRVFGITLTRLVAEAERRC
ncbi:MAG: helix-turn-helix transcriptional regulator [Verrucomicrobia bacterium]|nr:helix-turn-helix transcriptional regulator [Verrucomicrobiota bacterium]